MKYYTRFRLFHVCTLEIYTTTDFECALNNIKSKAEYRHFKTGVTSKELLARVHQTRSLLYRRMQKRVCLLT